MKYHHFLVNLGLTENLTELCDVFKQEGYHGYKISPFIGKFRSHWEACWTLS